MRNIRKQRIPDRVGTSLPYQPDDPRSKPIKRELRSLLKRATKMVVVIGEFTHESNWVNWEIQSFYDRYDSISGDSDTRDLPPKKESSCNVRLELKIKGVNHGQEGIQTGADHQDDVVTTSESSTGMVPVISTFESSTQILIFSISNARRFISKSKSVSFSRTS